MTTTALLIFALALLVNAGSPGPAVAALVARVISSGPYSVLPFLLAMWIGEVGWLLAAILGLGIVAQKLLLVLTIIKFGGVAYLLYLAWKMWHAPVDVHGRELPVARSSWKMFMAGLSVTIGNPKIVLFYLAFLPSLMNLPSLTVLDAFKLSITCLCVMAFTDLSWVTAAAWARRLLKSPRAIRIANRSSACAMGAAAVAIAAK